MLLRGLNFGELVLVEVGLVVLMKVELYFISQRMTVLVHLFSVSLRINLDL